MNTPSVTSQGVEVAGGHSGVVAPEIPTSAEPNPTAPKIPAPIDPTPTPRDSNVEVRQPGKDSEDPAVDLNSRGRQSRKRKASFSSGRPTPQESPSSCIC